MYPTTTHTRPTDSSRATSRPLGWLAPTPPASHLVYSGRNPEERSTAGGLLVSASDRGNRGETNGNNHQDQPLPDSVPPALTNSEDTAAASHERRAAMESSAFNHQPVMLDEVVELFASVPSGVVIDATLGGGGHAQALLEAHPNLRLLGIDQDEVALAAAGERLGKFGDRVQTVHGRFDQLEELFHRLEPWHNQVDAVGVLFDLGVSSPQLDVAERGFSYRSEGPLDMRMNPSQSLNAEVVVNTYSLGELTSVLARFGEDRHARRVAQAIVAARPITSTTELAEIVKYAIPAPARRRGGHPATRTFQAIRIEVNAELDILASSLRQAIEVLRSGGRCAVLSYHSGEDRIVKREFLNAESGGCQCPPGLPCVCGAEPEVRILRRGGWTPSAVELERNHRAASARLRAVEKLERGHA